MINIDHGHVGRPRDVDLVPGIARGLQLLEARGFRPIVVTNQAGIAKGYYTRRDFHEVMDDIRIQLLAQGAALGPVYFCPCHPDFPSQTGETECDCRKPSPGMLEAALADFPADRGRSLLIGDQDTDMEAARAAGVAGHLYAGDVPLDEFILEILDEEG